MKVACTVLVLALIAVLVNPRLLTVFDPNYHPKEPHGKQDPRLVGIWVGGDRQYPAILIIKQGGRMNSGWRRPGFWHAEQDTLNLDSMSWCGPANDGAPGSRAVTYQLKWATSDSFTLTTRGHSALLAIYVGTWKRVDPSSEAYQNSVRDQMEQDYSLRAFSVADALCYEGFWKREEFFSPAEESDDAPKIGSDASTRSKS